MVVSFYEYSQMVVYGLILHVTTDRAKHKVTKCIDDDCCHNQITVRVERTWFSLIIGRES